METRNGAVVIALVTLFCASVVGCEAIGIGEEDAQQDLRSGPYAFTAYDSTGTPIIEGTLNLSYPQDSGWDIEGIWKFEEINEVDGGIERMIGEGQLRGTMREGGSVQISLRPEIADADAVLRGEPKEKGPLRGEWAIVGWGMTSRSGRFEASPK